MRCPSRHVSRTPRCRWSHTSTSWSGRPVWPCSIPIPAGLPIWLPLASAGLVLAASLSRVALRGPQAAPAGRLALVSGHADSGDRSGPGRQPRDGRSVHVPARDRPLPHCSMERSRTVVENLPVSAHCARGWPRGRDRLCDRRTHAGWLLADKRNAVEPCARGHRGQFSRARGYGGSAVAPEPDRRGHRALLGGCSTGARRGRVARQSRPAARPEGRDCPSGRIVRASRQAHGPRMPKVTTTSAPCWRA